LDLAPIGMELCFLFTIPDVGIGVPVPLPGQAALWTIGVPNRTDLVGYRFLTQALVIVPTAPGLGAILSNPGRGVIGGE
jgi:hypothetical protein